MSIFNWNTKIENIPTEWRETQGKGVKIAILDSGAQLDHPALNHLKAQLGDAAHFFYVGDPNFNPTSGVPTVNGDISDALPMGEAHGTACLSILAAQPEGTDLGLSGMVPDAEFFVIKISSPDKAARNGSLVNGIDLALKLGADIIVCSILPRMSQQVSDGRLTDVFQRISDQKVLLFTTLLNTDDFETFNKIMFPSSRAESIVTGVATSSIVNSKPSDSPFDNNIDFLFAAAPASTCTADAYDSRPAASSIATIALGGIAALCLANARAKNSSFRRFSRVEMLSALQTCAKDYDPAALISAQSLQFYKKPSNNASA